jgi:hypothetical protein
MFRNVSAHFVVPADQLGRILLVKSERDLLKTLERVFAVGSVDFVQVGSESFHLRKHANRKLSGTFQLHDVHLRPQVFGQMSVNSKRDYAIDAFERSRVRSRWGAKRRVDVDLVEVSDRPFVLLKVAFGAKGDSARVASERSLKIMDVDVESQLSGLGKNFVANSAFRFSVCVRLKYFCLLGCRTTLRIF